MLPNSSFLLPLNFELDILDKKGNELQKGLLTNLIGIMIMEIEEPINTRWHS